MFHCSSYFILKSSNRKLHIVYWGKTINIRTIKKCFFFLSASECIQSYHCSEFLKHFQETQSTINRTYSKFQVREDAKCSNLQKGWEFTVWLANMPSVEVLENKNWIKSFQCVEKQEVFCGQQPFHGQSGLIKRGENWETKLIEMRVKASAHPLILSETLFLNHFYKILIKFPQIGTQF